MKKTETWRCLGRIETKTNFSGLWLSWLTNTNQYTIWDTCFNLHFYSWHSTPNLWWMTKIFLGGGLCVCGPSHVPVATVADPNVQESHPGRSPQSPCSQAADHLPPRAPKPRLVFPWVKCFNQNKVSVQFLCAVLPEARLILVLIKQFTLVQLSSYISNPQNVWISPTALVCFPWDTLGEKNMKYNFLKCWLPLGCGFSYILLWMTSHKSFAWASSTVLICVFQVYDE